MIKRSWLTPMGVLVAVMEMAIWSACTDNSAIGPDELASGAAGAETAQGVQPVEYPGNFVSSTDNNQVCFDMSRLGYIGEVTGDMVGFKVDPPSAYSDGSVSTSISPNGRFLDWVATGDAKVLAFIIKGGNTYNLYDYTPYNHSDDQLLHSPVSGNKMPQISHYNVCYDNPGDMGCTPGYWRNHTDRWEGVAPTDNFNETFGVTQFGSASLCDVISAPQTYGTLAFHAVAGLLNAYGGVPNGDGTTVNYPYSPEEVISGYAAGTDFSSANEAGCPLSGTSAVKCGSGGSDGGDGGSGPGKGNGGKK